MHFQNLTKFLDSLPEYGIPGCDLAVFVEHQPVYRHQAGFADRESGKRMDGSEIYNLYSVTKPITCAAALQLLEQGKFLLTDSLETYIPAFADTVVQETLPDGSVTTHKPARSINMADIFSMSAGLDYNLKAPEIDAVLSGNPDATTRDVADAIAREPLHFEPGTRWNYSLCLDVLGAVIEVISGRRFGEYLQEHIFAPLGMKDSGFTLPQEKAHRLCTQYYYDDARQCAEPQNGNVYRLTPKFESGGAGLYSTVDDYILFADALACGGVGKNGARILQSCTIDLMRRNQLDAARMRDFNWIQMTGYGYGCGVRTMVDPAKAGSLGSVGEFGWGGAAGAYLMVDPSKHLAVYYGQHMLNNKEPYVHPRIRNLVYAALDD